MKVFTCFVEKKNQTTAVATEFLFKETPVIIPLWSPIIISVPPKIPLPDPETIVPGFEIDLKLGEKILTEKKREKQLFYYHFNPSEFLFKFSEKFRKYEQMFILFKKYLRENKIDKAKILVEKMKIANEFMYLVFRNNGYFALYADYFSKNIQTLLKHLKLVHKNIVLSTEQLSLNLY